MTRSLRLTQIPLLLASAAALALLTPASARAQSLPPLPTLPLESYEPAIRAPIEVAWADVKENPGDPARNGILGMVLYAHEQYEYAVPCFERAHGMDPGEGRWSYYLGRAELYLGNHRAAVGALLETLRLQPTYVPAQVLLAQALLEGGQEEDAWAVYTDLADGLEHLAEVHYGLGRLYAGRGDLDAAAASFEKACALYPSFGAAHFALARAYRDRGEEEKAREHLALYQKDKTGWPVLDDRFLADIVALRDSSTDHLRRGVYLAEEGRLQEAAEAHEAALAEDPGLVLAHVNLIRIYGQLDDVARAEEHYQAAVAQDPDRAEIYYNYGVLLARKQRAAEAREAFGKAIELQPGYPEAHNNYAYLLMTSGDLVGAARHYRAALEDRPDYREAHFNLGRILVSEGNLEEAIEHLRQTLLPEDEETPRCTYALAAAYARAGNREEALRYMEQAREKAAALGQAELLGSIDRDLGALKQATATP